MPVTVVLQRHFRRNGRIYIRFKDKNEYEFESLTHLRERLRESWGEERADAHRLAIQYWLARSADGSDDASIRNQRFRVDMGAVAPITVIPDV